MRSVFNISKELLVRSLKKNDSFQMSKSKRLFRIMKASENRPKIDVAYKNQLLRENYQSFMTQQKTNDHLRQFGKQRRVGLTFLLSSRFSTEVSNSNTQKSFYIGGDFMDTYSKGSIFVDKSLFIQQIIRDKKKVILITMPRRWGKSSNLEMLRRFLSIEERCQEQKQLNRRKFTEEIKQGQNGKTLLDISKSQIKFDDKENTVKAIQLQGKYPVIFMNFKVCQGQTLKQVQQSLQGLIVQTIQKFGYLEFSQKSFSGSTTIGQKYLQILKKTVSGNYKTAILQLSQLLFYYHNRQKVWILIDEYDSAANKAFMQFKTQDPLMVAELFRKVLDPALKDNYFVEKSVLTGVQYILKSGMLSGLNNLTIQDFTSQKYSKYYGIDQNQMDLLLKLFGINDEESRLQIKQWYNGYKQNRGSASAPKLIDKYNIWSVANYLQNRTKGFKSYWGNSKLASFISKKLLQNSEIKGKIEDLIYGGNVELKPFVRNFTVDNFKVLKAMVDNHDQIEISTHGVNLFFSYLAITGYLTPTYKNNQFAIPNKEIKTQFENILKQYYQVVLGISSKQLQGLKVELDQVFSEKNNQNIINIFKKGFFPKFQALIQKFQFYHNHDDKKTVQGIYGNEDIMHSLLNVIAMQVSNVKLASQRYIQKTDQKKGRADICLSKNGKSIIIQMKYIFYKTKNKKKEANKLLKQALIQAKKYQKLAEETHTKIFIGCVVTSDKEVFISSNLNTKDVQNILK